MKSRACLVSNSSSSSFIIYKKDLTDSQISQIMNWRTECKQFGMEIIEGDAGWEVEDYGKAIGFYTSMDNFDMKHYLEKCLTIDPNIIRWRS